MRITLIFLGVFLSLFTGLLEAKELMMATTTSTDNTGLLDYLAKDFKKDSDIELKWVATGTGKALKLGEACDVDVLLVHAKNLEEKFVKKGFGVKRIPVMYNDFVLVGPEKDRAKIRGKSICEALRGIAQSKVLFFSRGDESGTHKKELFLWKKCNLNPEKAKWYRETGQGMLATLRIAGELGGYTLTDRGTYIKYSSNHDDNPPLKILVEGDKELFNQYSVIAVNPKACPKVRYELANEFIKWITSKKVQKKIANFKLLGKQLFIPNAR